MDLIPLNVKANCVMDDAGLYEHIRLSLTRDLPLVLGGKVVLVGSGPSVKGLLESIRKQREAGHPIVAIKDAHDWLISEGFIPDYAVAIDPQEHRWNCFRKKHKDVQYLIASQCHPAMFEHLKDMNVRLWHIYIREGQTYPPDSFLVTGGTTSGLRTINLFYGMGYRQFELYGYDSCLQGSQLRMDGTKASGNVGYVVVGGRKFLTTPEMAAQANEFQNLFEFMPDVKVNSHGEGLITAILEEREKQGKAQVSFIHSGGPGVASFRYRAKIPAKELRASLNDVGAEIVVFAKPTTGDDHWALLAKNEGRKVVVDFCDDHFELQFYQLMARYADHVTCPTEEMASRVRKHYQGPITVISDPYEFPLVEPHCSGRNVLWFGHGSNLPAALPVIQELGGVRVVSNVPNTIPWSMGTMLEEFAKADIVILPATAAYKSPNRAVEAIRQGCFVVAEPHPALNDFPGIWIGNIPEGVAWASQNTQLANERTKEAQKFTENFAPARLANAWKTVFSELSSISVAGESFGTDGSTSISTPETFAPTCEPSLLSLVTRM